jgi:hypothetical protein
MFLKDKNGNRMSVDLKINEVPLTENYEKKAEGSNKMMLYIALVIGLVVAIGSGYMLLKSDDGSQKNYRKNFGYRL